MDAPTFTASKCLNVSVKTQKKEHPHESIYSWYRLGKKLAKNVFQLHGVGCNGQTVLKKKLTRDKFLPFLMQLEPCLIGMEACASSHHFARVLRQYGHEVKLIPPQYVKPYVKTNKTDAADAEAICEAVARPNMRFVQIKTAEPNLASSCLAH